MNSYMNFDEVEPGLWQRVVNGKIEHEVIGRVLTDGSVGFWTVHRAGAFQPLIQRSFDTPEQAIRAYHWEQP